MPKQARESNRISSYEDEVSGAFQSLFFQLERVRKKAKFHALEAESLLKKCQENHRELKSMNKQASQLLSRCGPMTDELQKIIWLDNKLHRLKENKPKLT